MQLDEEVLHHARRARSSAGRMRSIDSSSCASGAQTFAKATMRPAAAHHRDGRRDRYARLEASRVEKRFSRVCLCPSHVAEMARARRATAARASRPHHLEPAALTLHPALRLPRAPCARRRRARNRVSGTRASSPSLRRPQAEVEIDRQVLRAHLVERGEPAVPIRELAEPPRQLGPDRSGVPTGSPMTIQLRRLHAVHDEAAPSRGPGAACRREREVRAARWGEARTSCRRALESSAARRERLERRRRVAAAARPRTRRARAPAPASARSERDACASTSNCHQSSCEYSTCR